MNVPDRKSLFILIDDDPVNNAISRLTIANTIPKAAIVTFEDPRIGLEFLSGEFSKHSATSVVILLNLNMPFMSGWEFLERFAKTAVSKQERIHIYILSSSIDPADRKKSEQIRYVKGFLNKPLSAEMIRDLATHL